MRQKKFKFQNYIFNYWLKNHESWKIIRLKYFYFKIRRQNCQLKVVKKGGKLHFSHKIKIIENRDTSNHQYLKKKIQFLCC